MQRFATHSKNVLASALRSDSAAQLRCLRVPASDSTKTPVMSTPQTTSDTPRVQQQVEGKKSKMIDAQDFSAFSKYWEQYIDEYYEEVECDEDEMAEEELEQKTVAEERILAHISNVTAEQLVELLREQRTKNIVCLDMESQAGPYRTVIICSPHNARHAEAVVQNIRKFIKRHFYYPRNVLPAKTLCPNGWWTIDMHDTVIHMMTDKARDQYDLEKLYTTGWSAEEELANDLESQYRPPVAASRR